MSTVKEGIQPTELLDRAKTIYSNKGPVSLARIGRQFAGYWLRVAYFTALYRVKYSTAAPKPAETLRVDPAEIEYVMSKLSSDGSRIFPAETPPFGVVGGSWDQKKLHRYDHGEMWTGLLQRYRDDKPWEETSYFQTGKKRLEDETTLRVMDGTDHSMEQFETYLSSLDEVYESMQTDGFDESETVPVNIGRDGEFILFADGNHRTTIAHATGIESIPVSVVYRHERWQAVRMAVSSADSTEQLSPEIQSRLDHPDLRPLLDASEA